MANPLLIYKVQPFFIYISLSPFHLFSVTSATLWFVPKGASLALHK
jgi:hypothetical protein